jgi:hypothetical protein
MSKLIWIEVKDRDRARRLAEMLQSSGVQADISRTVRGTPEVRIKKPRLRRMKPFMVGIVPVVRQWLEEQAPDMRGVIARTVDRRYEIRSPIAHAAAARARHVTPA